MHDFSNTSQLPGRAGGSLAPYLRAIRAHRLLVATIVLAALAGSIAWLVQREPEYEATAQMLVTPLPETAGAGVGLQVLRESSDPARTMQTAANLVDSPAAAEQTARELGGGYTRGSVRSAIEIEPLGQSNILSVKAKAEDPDDAARIANEFTTATLNVRREEVTRQAAEALRTLRARQEALDLGDPQADQLAQTVFQLEAIQAAGDPTLSISQQAQVPGDPVGAPPWLVVIVVLLAGFALAAGSALLIELLDRRVRDEDDVIERYPLPVLANVPALPRNMRDAALVSPLSMPPGVREAFRTIQIQLDQRGQGSRVVMITSASTGDGKTTTAVNLAFAIGRAGDSVILIDLDLRKRDISRQLSVEGAPGLVAMLSEDRKLTDLAVPAPELPTLRVVPAGAGNMVLFEALARRLPSILAEARQLADYVVLDTAPLGEVSDALRVTDAVDDVLLVARPGHTDRMALERTRDLLERSGSTPTGLVLVGQDAGAGKAYRGYYPYGAEAPESASRIRVAR